MLRNFLARILGPSTKFGTSPSNVNERNVTAGIDWNQVYRDRYNYDREKVQSEALLAWRLNPLARRLVTLTRQYVCDGIEFSCAHEGTAKFLAAFWSHPLNQIGSHLTEWCDELSLTGNLFPMLTTDSAGMSYARIMPTDQVHAIEYAPNDVQQETGYVRKGSLEDVEPKPIPSYQAKPKAKTVMLALRRQQTRRSAVGRGRYRPAASVARTLCLVDRGPRQAQPLPPGIHVRRDRQVPIEVRPCRQAERAQCQSTQPREHPRER